MKTLKARHLYKLKKKFTKGKCPYKDEIMPMDDLEVPNDLFNSFYDSTEQKEE